VARIEATALGLDIRYIVTSLPGRAQDLYEAVYCERGQAENLIKLHKTQLAFPRTIGEAIFAIQSGVATMNARRKTV
jgi:hypothetical protein